MLTNDEILNQINKIYSDSDRKWVDKIMVIKNNKLIGVYQKKTDYSQLNGLQPVFTNISILYFM